MSSDIGELSLDLWAARRRLLADLVGSYVFGSVVTGDFDPGLSDVDTGAVPPVELDSNAVRGP